jgi:hypothetical protein
MNLKRFLVAGLVGGVVANVYDYVVHAQILEGSYYSQLSGLLRPDAPILWLVVGDFVAAFVLTWVWARVHPCFGAGAKGGALGGFYAGVLIFFPSQIFLHLLLVGFPYALAWIWTITGILWAVIVGAVIGALYKP